MRTYIWLLICLLASTARASAQEFVYPLDVAVAKDGSLLIADLRLPGILKYQDQKLSVLVQGKPQFRTPLNAIRCIHIADDGTILAGDSATREVYKVGEDQSLTPLTQGMIGIPTQITSQGDTVYVTDLELQRVWKFPMTGGEPQEVAVVAGPRGVTVDDQNRVWILSPQKPQLLSISPDGTKETVVAGLTFNFPHQVILNGEGTAFVSDGYEKAIWRIPARGAPEKWVSGAPLVNPVGLAWHGDNLLVVDPRAKSIFSIDKDGKLTTLVGGTAK